MEAKALRHHLEVVDIYSNSWGARDGFWYKKPGPVTESALNDGLTLVCGIFVYELLPKLKYKLEHSIQK